MTTNNDEQLKTALVCAHRLKTTVCGTAKEFKHIRRKLLENLQVIKSTNVKESSPRILSTIAMDSCFDDDDRIEDHFQQVSDIVLDEHSALSQPSLVLFGPNSCGKTSLIQRFAGIGNILPSGIGPVTARIVQLTYAPAEQAFFRVYETIEKASVQCEGDLSHLFENQLQPDWAGVTDVIQPHVKRPSYIDEKSPEFNEWAKCFVEISLPSKVLALGIDIYDTPGFLSDNREQVLTDNLHKLVKRIKPTLVFLYENATISDTDKNCFLAMKNALGSMERVSVFFLNTKADCISIANDYYLDDDPENVTPDLFYDKLREKRQHCYDLLLRRREMANEVLGGLPKLVDECSCFDICTVPGDLDSWEEYSNLINTSSFQRLVEYAVKAYSAPTLTLARDILSTIDDYFDMTVSTSVRLPNQWKALRDEAIEWGRKFFDEYKEILPTLTNDLTTNILDLLERSKQEIVKQAALMIRNDDPIDRLLQDNRKTIIDYVRIAVQEQVIKVAANDVIIKRRDEVKNLIAGHFQRQRGLRKNELLTIAQRHVLSEISADVLQHTTLFNIFLDNMIKLPMRVIRFVRSLPTRLSAYQDLYNRYIHNKITRGENDVYELLAAMDEYATLSNETNRRAFADYCLKKTADELGKQKETFGRNLIAWIVEQNKAFDKNVISNYSYITEHLSDHQTLHDLISQFSGPLAKVECQLWAAIELVERNGNCPILDEQIDSGGFYSVHAAHWSAENNLAVKKLLNPSAENEQMAALEAHHHRVVTRWCSDFIVPFLHLYENNINDNQRELWIIMPRYSMSLRTYLMRNIHTISFVKALCFALTIAKALNEFHRLELVHRDLKSSNIMLDHNYQCYITDFGTSRFGLSNQTFLGTAPLPPEMIAAHLQTPSKFTMYDGTAVDVFSFGLLLYEILPKTPYGQLDINALLHIEEILFPTPELDPVIKAYKILIQTCLNREPEKRPTANNLVSELTHIQHMSELKLCMACDERARALRFVPCGHKVMCTQCWETWCRTSNGNACCILCQAIVTNYNHDDSNATFYLQ